jgi:hypothetical protein
VDELEPLCEAGLEEDRFAELVNRFAEISLRITTAWSRVEGVKGFILHDDLTMTGSAPAAISHGWVPPTRKRIGQGASQPRFHVPSNALTGKPSCGTGRGIRLLGMFAHFQGFDFPHLQFIRHQ